jgi:acyl carrier protein
VNSSEVQQILRTFIVGEWLQNQDRGFDGSTPLLEWGILDSLRMVALLAFIEERFGVRVPDDAVTPANFGTVDAISQWVAQASRT